MGYFLNQIIMSHLAVAPTIECLQQAMIGFSHAKKVLNLANVEREIAGCHGTYLSGTNFFITFDLTLVNCFISRKQKQQQQKSQNIHRSINLI